MGKGASTKGYLQNLATKKLMKFIYNPEQYEYGFSTEYATVKAPGSPLPLYQLVGGNEKTINLSILLDGRQTSQGKVQEWIIFLESFHPSAKGNMNSFNSVGDAWFCVGPFLKNVIIKDVTIRPIQFNTKLYPIMVEVDLSMEIVQEFK